NILFKTPSNWTQDGQLIFFQLDPDTAYNIYAMPADASAAPTLLVGAKARDVIGHVSPDGKWLAHLSEFGDAGFELCVQSYPKPGRNIQLSTGGAIGFCG